jgi:phosphoglycolate phosphatase
MSDRAHPGSDDPASATPPRMTADAAPPGELLDGIDLLIFDKDGTLIDFQRMWRSWVDGLARALEAETRLDLAGPLAALLGVDPTSGLVLPHGLLAATPMSQIRSLVVAWLRDAGLPSAKAEAAVAAAWHAPDPVALAHPVTDLPSLLGRLRRSVPGFAIVTSDDRDPTMRTLIALGIEAEFGAIACADEGIAVKPAPDAVLAVCRTMGVAPGRAAVVGDAPADLRMGRAAGAGRVIGVLTGVGDTVSLAPLADALLPSIEALAPV